MYINNPGHMTKMAATHIYGKNLYKSPEPVIDFNETWHEVWMTQILQCVYKS